MPSRRRERGQDLVEYALILPILVALVLGIVEFGLIIFTQNTIGDAAQVGARYGVIRPTDCAGVRNRVWGVTDAASLARGNLTVPCPTLAGGAIRVEVRYSYTSVTHLFDVALPRPFVLRSVATMMIE